MIFAAGRGTRMAPLTDTVPKPLIQVAGRALLDHALDLSGGIETVVVNTHYLADKIEAHLRGTRVTTIFEDPVLETGGGLRNALPFLGDGPVLTLNSDATWHGPNVLDALCEAWNGAHMEALVALVPPERAVGHRLISGFAPDADGRLTRGPQMAYTGAQIITTKRLADISEQVFSINLLWDRMITSGTLFGMEYMGRWCDVGRPENIAMAEEMIGV